MTLLSHIFLADRSASGICSTYKPNVKNQEKQEKQIPRGLSTVRISKMSHK